MMAHEQWRPVVGYESSYEVSDMGRVRSLDRTVTFPDGRRRTARGRLLKPGHVPRGHRYVNLGRGNSQYVHQLVAAAFLGPRPDGHEVCHNNGDPTDNRAPNLRYDTRQANYMDMFVHGTHPQARKTHCKNGHEFSEDNTAIRRDRYQRVCLICKREGRKAA